MASPNFAHNQATFRVVVGGIDVTDKLNPYLTGIDVKATAQHATDTATIELADNNGELGLPTYGDDASVDLGWQGWGLVNVFQGIVSEVNSLGSRSGGRMLIITCTAANMAGGTIKQPRQAHVDKQSFAEAAQTFAGKSGMTALVHSALGAISRDWWGMNNESFAHWGQRMASELGATFRVQGNTAAFVPRGTGQSVSGATVGGVVADYSGKETGNGLSWQMIPRTARPPHAVAAGKFFDMVKAEWNKVDKATGLSGIAKAVGINLTPAADQAAATDQAGSAAADIARGLGKGTVTIVGDPDAQVTGTCEIIGAREGVDGTYEIDTLEHRLRRTEGFITILGLVMSGTALSIPAGDAGAAPAGAASDVGVHPSKDVPA